VKAASNADYIIACVGDHLALHGEGKDRSNLDLSGKQQQLLSAMKASGKKLIVVFISSKPLAISWIKENADALVCMFNPGSKGGLAAKEVLFGEINPSGKLTISFPHSAGQIPVYYNSYPGWHTAREGEQERYIDAPAEPVFAFGEGIGYSPFVFSDLKVLTKEITKGESAKFEISIQNTGSRGGIETVQLYIRDEVSSVTTPVKNLKAFERVSLTPQQSQRIHFEIPWDALALVKSDLKRVVEPGDFTVMIGSSSKDCDLLCGTFRVKDDRIVV